MNPLPPIECDSAGTIGIHQGSPPDTRMRAAGMKRGISIRGAARPVKPGDFDSFDLILAMDEQNLADLRKLASHLPAPRARLQLFCEYCVLHDDRIVPDPYYGGESGFEYVLDLLEDGCANLLAALCRPSSD